MKLHQGYSLRLLFAATADKTLDDADDANGVFVFSTSSLLINTPPSNGRCVAEPDSGAPVMTKFTLQSVGWVDDDLPLSHQFNQIGVGGIEGQWGSSKLEKIFSGVGEVGIVANVKDSLGSISTASAT